MHYGPKIGYALLLLLCYLVRIQAFTSRGIRSLMRHASSCSETALFGEMDGFDVSSKPEKAVGKSTEVGLKASPLEPLETSTKAEIETQKSESPLPADLSDSSISNSMKDKLKQELQAQGAYSNKKSANPILVIGAVVAVAVIIGGQGFFY